MKLNLFFFLLLVTSFTISGIAQIPNSGFENWETDPDGNNNPVGWQTTNSFPVINVEPYSPGCDSIYAMTVKTISEGIAFPGVAILETAYSFTWRPVKFTACVKSNIISGDQAYIMLALMKGDTAVAAMDSCTFKIDSTISQFINIEFPIVYLSDLLPDSLIIIVASGLLNGMVGTELTIDEIGFIYGPTDVTDNENFPEEFELYQNYPNPFNPTTKIQYSIPYVEASLMKPVQLIIYDILGKEVATLVNEEKPSGTYEITWYAGNLPSGVYFYQLRAGSFMETKKMVLMK